MTVSLLDLQHFHQSGLSNNIPTSYFQFITHQHEECSGVLPVLSVCPSARLWVSPIAQFAITINSNVCPHIRVLNTLMRESYA